jgi:8-amino-7-oxononanoate synthase
MVGDDRRAMEAMSFLLERGLLVAGIRPPTVPPGTARLRLSLSAALTTADLDLLTSALSDMERAGWFVPRGTAR